MANFIMLGIYLISVVAFNSVKCFNKVADLKVEITITQNMTQFLSGNDDTLRALYQLARKPLTDNSTALILLPYAAGGRVNGDHLVASESNFDSWDNPNDRRLTINYPSSGVGAIITYIQALVEQSTSQGKATITRGGIGYRYVEFDIDAYQTTHFGYNVEIYGYE